jgi:DNA-binding transcriptional LysR family regulator
MDKMLMSIMEPDRWLGVELRHFAALQALASEGSFGRAAERLGYTQSAVSQQIATLERIVGEKLVERPGGPRPISLTEAGELLLRHADSIVARLQAAQADLHALQAGEVGTLRVGTFQSAGARLLPAVMRRFTEAWPGIDVVIEELDDEEVEQAIERGELDVGFVALPVSDAPLEWSELVHDPYVLVSAAGSPFATSSELPSLAELGAAPLIGFKEHRSVEAVEAVLRAAGVEPRYAFRSNDNGTVQGLVAAGIGNAVQPLLTVDLGDPRIVVVRTLEEIPPRVIAIARHRDRYYSPAARAFVDAAVATATTRP